LSRRLFTLLFGLVAICAEPARAAGLLQWDFDHIEVAAKKGQTAVQVAFPFRNVGDKPVTIVSVETSCRCTSAETAKDAYAPGEKGTLAVEMKVGGQEGVVEKSVTVTTDGAEPKAFVLSLRVTLPAADNSN
jgi:hypothetical protein